MPTRISTSLPSLRNPQTKRAHRREVWWQIIFPLLLGVALGCAGLYALLSGRFGDVQNAAGLATILIIVPIMVIGVVLFLLSAGLIFALGRAMHWIPTQTIKAQRLAKDASNQVARGANMLAGPLLFFDSWANAVSSVFKRRR